VVSYLKLFIPIFKNSLDTRHSTIAITVNISVTSQFLTMRIKQF